MGLLGDLLDSLLGSGSSSSSDDSKGGVYYDTTSNVSDDGSARVRNAAYITEKGTDNHITVFSTTDVDGKTGNVSTKEGGHGENYHGK